jgi:hypothetical protein
MIVRNEESNLPACLESVKGVFDEIIVVETGSTDRTREVAADHGARVIDFPWIDSFAAARNESLRHAGGDWIFTFGQFVAQDSSHSSHSLHSLHRKGVWCDACDEYTEKR